MNTHLFEILACPSCKGKLNHQSKEKELVCKGEQLAFPIKDGIPAMLLIDAHDLNTTANIED